MEIRIGKFIVGEDGDGLYVFDIEKGFTVHLGSDSVSELEDFIEELAR
jgi:hypothetical protein